MISNNSNKCKVRNLESYSRFRKLNGENDDSLCYDPRRKQCYLSIAFPSQAEKECFCKKIIRWEKMEKPEVFIKKNKMDMLKLKNTWRAALVAVSKTSRTPSLLLAEHSRYANALIFSAMVLPSSGLTGSCFILPNSLIVLESFRKSWNVIKSLISVLSFTFS